METTSYEYSMTFLRYLFWPENFKMFYTNEEYEEYWYVYAHEELADLTFTYPYFFHCSLWRYSVPLLY